MQKRRSTSSKKEVDVNPAFIKDAVMNNIYSMKLVGNEHDVVDIDIDPTLSKLTIYYRKESLRPKKTE